MRDVFHRNPAQSRITFQADFWNYKFFINDDYRRPAVGIPVPILLPPYDIAHW